MAVVTFIKQHISTTNASTYTFSSTSTGGANDVGATASDRQVIVAGAIAATATTLRQISSITIGGVTTATALQKNMQFTATNVSPFRTVGHNLVNALVTTATTANVVLSATTTVSNASIVVWSATHVGASFATFGNSFASVTSGYATFSTATMNLVVNSNGFAVAHAHADAGGAVTFTWTNLTERNDTNYETNVSHSGADNSTTATNGKCVSSAAPSAGLGVIWGAFDDNSPAGTAETLYRTFLPLHSAAVGRRPLMAWSAER